MITKDIAIQIGVQVRLASQREREHPSNTSQAFCAINAVEHRALQNLWYDAFPAKVRAKFDYVYENYIAAVALAVKNKE